MIRLTCLFALLPGLAAAHMGDLGELAGHDHWVAGIAIGATVAVGVWGAIKGRKDPEPEPPSDSADKTPA
jgi:hypothetical protein